MPSGSRSRQLPPLGVDARRSVRPGRKLTRDRASPPLELRAQPVARRVQRHRSADAEMRPEQRAAAAGRATAPSTQTASSTSCDDAGELAVQRHRLAPSTSGASAGVVGTIVWPSRRAISSPAPSLPLFGSDWPPVASTTAPRAASPPIVTTRNPSPRSVDVERRGGPARSVTPARVALAQQARRGRRATRFVSGNSLPSASSCSGDADLAEERDRVGDRKRAQHAADDRRPAAPEIALGDDGVGDVAARAAADEDFAPGVRAPSRRTTDRVGLNRRVKMAVARPAAPAPTTATSQDWGSARMQIGLASGAGPA